MGFLLPNYFRWKKRKMFFFKLYNVNFPVLRREIYEENKNGQIIRIGSCLVLILRSIKNHQEQRTQFQKIIILFFFSANKKDKSIKQSGFF